MRLRGWLSGRRRAAALAVFLVPLASAGSAPAAAPAPAWRALPDAPQARSEVAAAVLDGRIALVGGFLADGTSSPRADLYDPASGRWSRLPDLPRGVDHAMAAAAGGSLYVMGGHTPSGRGRRAFVLRPGRGWRELPPLPQARSAGGAAVVGGRVYVIGGLDRLGGRATRSFSYDIREGRWRAVPGPPTARDHLGVAALGGRIYAIGGRTGGGNLDAAEAYDPRSRRWARLPPLPTARSGLGAAVAAGLIVTIGGEGPEGTFPEVEGYDPRARRWRTLPPSPEPRHGVGVAAVGRSVYQLLGGPTPGLSTSATALELTLPALPRSSPAAASPPPRALRTAARDGDSAREANRREAGVVDREPGGRLLNDLVGPERWAGGGG